MAIYDPSDDKRLEQEQPKQRIVAWSILAVWDNGEEEQLTDIPPWAAGPVDEFLSSVEEHRQDEEGED
jgi:hypothetical protein